MFSKTLKRAGAVLLAGCMLIGSVQFPAPEGKAAEVNLALSASAAASNSETENGIANINDGSMDTRWAHDRAASSWVKYEWQAPQTMKSFVITWERKNAKAYALDISNDGQSWQTVWSTNTAPETERVEVTLAEAKTAKYLRLNITSIEAMNNWQAVSIYEFEVYEGNIPDNRSEVQKIADAVESVRLEADGSRITMPETAAGIDVRFCADYEQVIGSDGTVYTPYESKEIKGFYEITQGEDCAKTAEFTITVPGRYQTNAGLNDKPDVIPELQEWHGGEGVFAVSPTSRIVIGEGLEDTAEEFANDYKAIVGNEIQVIKGSAEDARDGDFYLTLETDDKGLGKEGYLLKAGKKVIVEAGEATGAYWATRSILQILKQTKGTIPQGTARDYPKYRVRGLILDVGRKPFELDTLKQFAKNMAWYKMNDFQVHLNDSLIFIKASHGDYASKEDVIERAYAAFRLESGIVNAATGKSATAEDLYYTKDAYRSFIKDSRKIGVNIVSEIDVPAHSLAFTRAFPEHMYTERGQDLVDHLSIQKQETRDFVKTIFGDYLQGEDPVFDKDAIVHIGTDEFEASTNDFRIFSDQLLEYVQGTGRTTRMWASLTKMTGPASVRSEGVQTNIWSKDWGTGRQMYEEGYDLINSLDQDMYIVPYSGYYHPEGLDTNFLYNTWQVNELTRYGGFLYTVPAGDDQMLGSAFAIWHDSIDTRQNGVTEYDSFQLFLKAAPTLAAKGWGEAEKPYAEFCELQRKTGTAPNTNMDFAVESATSTIVRYTFDGKLETDSSVNGYDAKEQKNVTQAVVSGNNQALQLTGGESYLKTPVDKVGPDNTLTMRVKMDEDASGEQILCESWEPFGETYGTYAIKAVQKGTGKVGFSREGVDYSFDYTLPAETWTELTFKGNSDRTAELYVNGEWKGTLGTEKLAINRNITMTATLLLPIGRIGSTTNSFKGQIDELTVGAKVPAKIAQPEVSQSALSVEVCSDHSEGRKEMVLDGDSSTYWHTDYSQNNEKGDGLDHQHYVKLNLIQGAKKIDRLTYLPRQDSPNGRITKYEIDVTDAAGVVHENYASGTWADNTQEKEAVFPPIEAASVKLRIVESYMKHGTAAEFHLYEAVEMDQTAMESELAKYEAITEKENYTSASWNEFVRIRQTVRKILDYADKTEEDEQTAYAWLQKLNGLLVENPNGVAEEKPPVETETPPTETPPTETQKPELPKPVPAKNTVFTEGNLQYKVTKSAAADGTAAVTKSLNKKAKSVTIPAVITKDGYTFKVTAVQKKVFAGHKKLKSVKIGENVNKIGAKCFYQDGKLKNIVWQGKKAPKIGKQALKGTAKKAKVVFPKKIKAKTLKTWKQRLQRAGLSKKASYKKK